MAELENMCEAVQNVVDIAAQNAETDDTTNKWPHQAIINKTVKETAALPLGNRRVAATGVYCRYHASKGKLMSYRDEESRDLSRSRHRRIQTLSYDTKSEVKYKPKPRKETKNHAPRETSSGL